MTSPNDLAKQQAFVQRTLEERNIRFVRLWFTDVLGFLKSVAIAPAELENAFAEGIGFDGSAIEGFARVSESDMLAKPDPASFSILPWRTESPGAARMFCDITLPDGSACIGKTVEEIELPENAAIAAIVRDGRVITAKAHDVFAAGDELLFVASADAEAQIKACFIS